MMVALVVRSVMPDRVEVKEAILVVSLVMLYVLAAWVVDTEESGLVKDLLTEQLSVCAWASW